MGNLNKKQYSLDAAGLISIGLLSLGYVLFPKYAEQHLQLPFLNFPIFVGEMLLFGCLILFLIKYYNNPQKLTKWHYVIICYFVFVVIKALYGYVKWGPLALRHSALLYYPVFIIFGYSFYRRKFFDWKTFSLLPLIIISIFVYREFYGYWAFTLMALGFILIKSHPHKIIKFVMFLALLFSVPYREFFHTSRMMIVSNLLSGLFLAGVFPFVLGGKKRFKYAIAIVIGGIFLLGMFKFANHSALKSIVNFKRMTEVFSSADKIVQAKIDYHNMEDQRDVKLYNPERVVNTRQEEIIFVDVKKEIKLAFVRSIKGKTELLAEQKEQKEQIKAKVRQILNEKIRREIETILAMQTNERIKEEIRQVFIEQVREIMETVSSEQIKEEIPSALIEEVRKEMWLDFEEIVIKNKEKLRVATVEPVEYPAYYNDNAVFRLIIWRDMLVDLVNEKPIFGIDFGKPFRSKSLEILHWGDGDWFRDGWIGAHNSYLHMVYRTGIVGIVLIICFLTTLFRMIKKFISMKSLTGILLCGIIINWFAAANFLLIFELPYTAIPIWTLFGLTYAYFKELKPLTSIKQ